MTDHISGYLVTLEESIREDDAEYVLNALRMVKGVLAVKEIIDTPAKEMIAEARVKMRLADKLTEALS